MGNHESRISEQQRPPEHKYNRSQQDAVREIGSSNRGDTSRRHKKDASTGNLGKKVWNRFFGSDAGRTRDRTSEAGPSRATREQRGLFAGHSDLQTIARQPKVQEEVNVQMHSFKRDEMPSMFPNYKTGTESSAQRQIRQEYLEAYQKDVASYASAQFLDNAHPDTLDTLNIPVGSNIDMPRILNQERKELSRQMATLLDRYKNPIELVEQGKSSEHPREKIRRERGGR